MARRKSRLKCFHGNHLIKGKIWRDADGKPYCESCMQEILYDEYEGEDWIIDLLKERYDCNLAKLKKDEMEVICPRCSAITLFWKSETNSEGKRHDETGWEGSCFECGAWLEFDKDGKVLHDYDSEDLAPTLKTEAA